MLDKLNISQKIVLVAAVVAVFIFSFIFRDKMVSWLGIGPDPERDVDVQNPILNKSNDSIKPILKEVEGEESEKSKTGAATAAKYQGRDPEEVRPVPEDVKVFSEEQKNQVFAALKTQGRAVKENPDYFFGWLQLGVLKKMIGDYEGAKDAWGYAGLIRPGNSVSFANLGELYWRYLPDFPKSEKNFRISIKNKPDDPSTYFSLSELYFYSYKEKAGLADDILLEGIKANPNDASLMKFLASLYERQGENAKSLEWWQKVLEKEPENKEVASVVEALKNKINH